MLCTRIYSHNAISRLCLLDLEILKNILHQWNLHPNIDSIRSLHA